MIVSAESESKNAVAGVPATAGVSEGIIELHVVRESDLRMRPGAVVASLQVSVIESSDYVVLIRHCALPSIH